MLVLMLVLVDLMLMLMLVLVDLMRRLLRLLVWELTVLGLVFLWWSC